MEINYSNYIRSQTSNYDKNLAKLKMFKNLDYDEWVKSIDLKAICSSTRYLTNYIIKNIKNIDDKNKLTEYCLESILRSNNSVENLRNYKKNFDKNWWNENKTYEKDEFGWRINNTWKKHSNYGENEKKIAEKIIKLNDNIHDYDVIRKIYNYTDNKEIKNLCLLITWMTYKIDMKCISYEKKT